MRRKEVILAAVATLGMIGASLAMSACGSPTAAPQRTVTVTPSTPPSTATPTTPVPSTPPATTAPAPAPAPTQPEITNPWAVVSAYYGDIESGNYAEAWSLLSPSMQASLGPYSGWLEGYQTTVQTNVSEISQAGDTVTVSITAAQADGTQRSYTGYYTVDNGKITSAHITQD